MWFNSMIGRFFYGYEQFEAPDDSVLLTKIQNMADATWALRRSNITSGVQTQGICYSQQNFSGPGIGGGRTCGISLNGLHIDLQAYCYFKGMGVQYRNNADLLAKALRNNFDQGCNNSSDGDKLNTNMSCWPYYTGGNQAAFRELSETMSGKDKYIAWTD
jgi:hypothetical protein